MTGTGARCHRCGQPMIRYEADVDYCRLCIRELAALAPKPEPTNLPEWRRRGKPKDMTEHGRAA